MNHHDFHPVLAYIEIVSQKTHYPAKSSNTPQSYASSCLFDANNASLCFPLPTFPETKGLYVDEMPKSCNFAQSRPSPVEIPTFSQPRWIVAPNSASLAVMLSDSSSPSNIHQVEPPKITEHETWSVSQLADTKGSTKNPTLSYPPFLSSYQQDTHTSPSPKTKSTSHRSSPPKRASSHSGITLSRASSTQTLFSLKTKKSASGVPKIAPLTDPKQTVQEVKTPPKLKTPAKISHSITERRYRENLRAKIVQLDETLASTRIFKTQAQRPEAQHEQSLETTAKSRKADILNEAMRYIKQAERDGEARNREIDFLRLRVAALEQLVTYGDCALLRCFAGHQIDYTGSLGDSPLKENGFSRRDMMEY